MAGGASYIPSICISSDVSIMQRIFGERIEPT